MAEGREVEYDRLVVIQNPVSHDAARTEAYLDRLRRKHFGRHLAVIPTESADVEDLVPLLRDDVGSKDVIGIRGGDGTLRLVVSALLHRDTPSNIKSRPVLPLWGGKANDGAHSLNPSTLKHHPHALLMDGKVRPVRPLHIQLTNTDENTGEQKHREQIAVLYAGFGITAYAAEAINQRRAEARDANIFKNARGDLRAIRRALQEARAFQTIGGDFNGKPFEILFNNGPRMAQFLRPNVQLDYPEYRVTAISDKRAATIISKAGLMAVGLGTGKYTTGAEEINFMILDPTRAQFDGEVEYIEENTSVTVGLHTDHFNAITTNSPDEGEEVLAI